MAKGGAAYNERTRFSSTYQPAPEKLKDRGSIQAALRRLMHDTDVRGPGVGGGKMTNAERVARVHLAKALKGDAPLLKEAYDRIDGKVVDKQALTNAEGEDVQLDDKAFAVWLASKLAAPKPGKE